MEFLIDNAPAEQTVLSIILLDWSTRDSFHVLDYLNHQRVDRRVFEVVWIEYYGRRATQISSLVERCKRIGLPSPVDKWIVLNRPESEYYHKHHMYNTGILNSTGRIVTILDSDAIVKTTFVETIIKEFEQDSNIALHVEEIRSFDKRFYPFNYPTIDDIITNECVNATDGIPVAFRVASCLKEDKNLMRFLNYGACLSATRENLIRIGGADEHEDYRGHICGPYDMTFRLINAGVTEKWHPSHYLYHAWHPGQGGTGNYCGPNDGRGMSTTAMEILDTGRILPLKENEGIMKLRMALKKDSVATITKV